MIRCRDARTVNGRAWAAGVDADFSEFLADPMHVCLLDERGGALFAWRGPGTYEAHVFFRVRGREALDLGEEMLAHMRANYGAERFWALVPVESRRVLMFVRLMGWKSLGPVETRHGWNELFTSETPTCHRQS